MYKKHFLGLSDNVSYIAELDIRYTPARRPAPYTDGQGSPRKR